MLVDPRQLTMPPAVPVSSPAAPLASTSSEKRTTANNWGLSEVHVWGICCKHVKILWGMGRSLQTAPSYANSPLLAAS